MALNVFCIFWVFIKNDTDRITCFISKPLSCLPKNFERLVDISNQAVIRISSAVKKTAKLHYTLENFFRLEWNNVSVLSQTFIKQIFSFFILNPKAMDLCNGTSLIDMPRVTQPLPLGKKRKEKLKERSFSHRIASIFFRCVS